MLGHLYTGGSAQCEHCRGWTRGANLQTECPARLRSALDATRNERDALAAAIYAIDATLCSLIEGATVKNVVSCLCDAVLAGGKPGLVQWWEVYARAYIDREAEGWKARALKAESTLRGQR